MGRLASDGLARMAMVALACAVSATCRPGGSSGSSVEPSAATNPGVTSAPPAGSDTGTETTPLADTGPGAPGSGAPVGSAAPNRAAPEAPRISSARAIELMLLDPTESEVRDCAALATEPERIRCLLSHGLAADPVARDRALRLFDHTGTLVGREPDQQFDGGWRGTIHLVPVWPAGPYRRHLVWIADALEQLDAFTTSLETKGGRAAGYRHRPLELRFFRSVGRTTPSAFAVDWTVSYNVSGSLHGSAAAVAETMFHEIFHLNDTAHGRWSETALPELVDPIRTYCRRAGGRLDSRCLAPYAPNATMVRGGTYYAFQPGNGVWEYAAELAVRYYKEHRVALGLREAKLAPFKCGPEPNGRTWQLLVDEFFGGIDLTPACPPQAKP